jgi:type VI secretion system secreted protein Hcp
MAIFLKIEGIDSDATEVSHETWIACTGMTMGTERPMHVETGRGTQRETTNPEFNEIVLSMNMHKGSPKVFMASVVGKAKTVTIHVTRTAEASGASNYLEITLTNTFVTNYTMSTGGDMPSESITLNFTKMTCIYKPNKPDGTPGAQVPVGYDLATAKRT